MEKKTLYTMLNKLKEAEDELIFISDDEIKELLGDVKGKVDSIKYAIAHLESEEVKIAAFIKAHQERKKAIANTIKRIKEHAAYTMNTQETPALFGSEWDIKLTESKSIEILSEPDDMAAIAFYDFVRTKYEWDKAAIKKALGKDPERLKDIAKLKTNQSIRFTSHKG